MPQFTLEISYSQIAIFNPSLDQPFNNWTEPHFNQGFVWRPRSVSFRTAARTGFGTIKVEKADVPPTLRNDALLAIRVPFSVTEPELEIASVFKGQTVPFEPGEYTLYFQTGRDGTAPWVTLDFVPGEASDAEILRGAEHLNPPTPLLMTGEPA